MRSRDGLGWLFATAMVAVVLVLPRGLAAAPKNLFTNPGFERGQSGWGMDKAGGTVASFKADRADAAAGQFSALVTVGKVEEWGVQFGQKIPAGKRGKTYTFAVLAKAVDEPVTVDLQIERSARPHDRAARTGKLALTKDKWTELHVTFRVKKDFPQGWFAYISCRQANCRFRADAFRLYQGKYVAYKKQAAKEQASAGVRLFDTGSGSAQPLSGDALAERKGWAQVPAKKTDHAFRGDAVLVNDRLAVVLRRKGGGAEVYSLGGAATLRAVLAPAGGTGLSGVKVLTNAPGEVGVEAAFKAPGGKTQAITCTLKMGQVYVETAPRAGVSALRVHAPCRFAVLPDFFADDIVVDATQLPVAKAELPADHFLLHLLPGRNALVMAVRNVATDDVALTMSGLGTDKTIEAAEIPYGKKGKIWLAVLAAPGVWHRRDVAAKDTDRVIRLDWAAPHPAAWRVDWRKDDGLIDSWGMIAERPDGRYAKYGWSGSVGTVGVNRKRWTTVLGSFRYPCWLDRSGRGYLHPLKRAVRFRGPALIYPLSRARQTPLETFTVVDVVRSTLGVGPCEYILDLEGQRSINRGIATCGCRSTLNPIYKAGRQRQERPKIERTLKDVIVFIKFIRRRIEEYVAFGHAVREYLDEQRKAHPELAVHLDKLDAAARVIDAKFAARRAKIKTPADAEKLVAEFRRTLLDYEGPDAFQKCRRFTEAWVAIGGDQDELVGECRLAVKVLRQRAALAVAVDPRMAEVARQIRRRSQKVLRNPASHEGANH